MLLHVPPVFLPISLCHSLFMSPCLSISSCLYFTSVAYLPVCVSLLYSHNLSLPACFSLSVFQSVTVSPKHFSMLSYRQMCLFVDFMKYWILEIVDYVTRVAHVFIFVFAACQRHVVLFQLYTYPTMIIALICINWVACITSSRLDGPEAYYQNEHELCTWFTPTATKPRKTMGQRYFNIDYKYYGNVRVTFILSTDLDNLSILLYPYCLVCPYNLGVWKYPPFQHRLVVCA